MKTSNDLLTLAEVCAYFGLSESTVRRKVRDSRDGNGNFPLPLFKSKCRVLWKKSDIENWNGVDGATIAFTPVLNLPPHLPAQVKTDAQIRRGLQALGVNLPPHNGDDLNN